MVTLTDSHIKNRKAHFLFDELLNFENRVLALNAKLAHMKSYIIGAGIMYGQGENIFYEWFKSAWLQNDPLYYITTGNNCLPLIHVNDVAKFVIQLLNNKYED